ncbi:GNAT family N-acetyltransferase [Natrialbaceae archaeon GCM10025810]|uniref:GNAT family N-acetyltransferase n=1 Tax=Halovalidus salilacus TaxID=3075124 RepID=UPI0036151220
MFVREATPDDHLEVRRILDAAMLEPGNVERRIRAGDVLVAGDHLGRPDRPPANGGGTRERILGTLVLEPHSVGEGAPDVGVDAGAHIVAIGVRRRHRGRGFGRRLIETALEREPRLTARFDEGVRPFYERLGFSIEPIDDRRYQGVKHRE